MLFVLSLGDSGLDLLRPDSSFKTPTAAGAAGVAGACSKHAENRGHDPVLCVIRPRQIVTGGLRCFSVRTTGTDDMVLASPPAMAEQTGRSVCMHMRVCMFVLVISMYV